MKRHRGTSDRVTIHDVAALAGVSTTTVSHALNGKGRVGEETRERVLWAAQRLRYSPSRAAQALRTRRTGLIAFLVPPFERPPTQTEMLSLDIYMTQAGAAARGAFRRGYALILIPPVESADELEALGVEGGIICDPLRHDRFIDMFESLRIPVVTIERQPGSPDNDWYVAADNEAGTRELLDHLSEAGATRVAMLSLEADTAWADETVHAYLGWCQERGQDPTVVPASPHQMENSAYEMACKLLDGPTRPDAILASAERFSTAVIRAARERGILIPGDLLLATGIDGWEAREASPPVTALDVNPALQGEKAAELLMARLEGLAAQAPVLTPFELRPRASTAAPVAGMPQP